MLSQLDLIRAKLLKVSFKLPFLQSLFLNRANRILLLFSLAACFYLTASSFFPLWVLLVGPILWGIPHLFSSIRYTGLSFEEKNRKKLFVFQFAMWSSVFAYRLNIDIFQNYLFLAEHPLLFETLCLLFSFIYQLYLNPKINMKLILSTLAFAILIAATYFYPLQTALVLLIGHNYVPLYAWFQSCQNNGDKKTFYISSFVYILFSLFIYHGTFDFLYQAYKPMGQITFLNWDYSQIMAPFMEIGADKNFWYRMVVLYSFSQAIHYFIWMKAIPENYQNQEFPPNFKWSFNKLASDFGQTSIILLMGILLVGTLMWLFFEFQTARLVYFSLASYHGFMEISALPFLKSNQKV